MVPVKAVLIAFSEKQSYISAKEYNLLVVCMMQATVPYAPLHHCLLMPINENVSTSGVAGLHARAHYKKTRNTAMLIGWSETTMPW